MGLIEEKYSHILNAGYDKTSSIFNLEDNSLSFSRNSSYLKNLVKTDKNVGVIIPANVDILNLITIPKNIQLFPIYEQDNIEYVFTYIHNYINKDREPRQNIIGKNVNIHETVVFGVHGNTYCTCPDGSKLNLKHMGNIIVEDNVDIEALSIIHRAGMASTIIGEGSKVCVMCNIGHNCIIGKRTFIAPGVLLGGGTHVGDNCYIWQGVITRSHAKICDRVVVGAGSLVMKDITEPGVYIGRPAKYIKPYDETLR